MNILFLSAFALSLMISLPRSWAQSEMIDDFFGLETEIMPELKGDQKHTPRDFHQVKQWNVKEESAIKDVAVPNKGQTFSIIPWKTLKPEEWLSIDNWIAEREIKDITPEWKIRLRHAVQKELIGKVLQCQGECSNFRGTKPNSIQYLSKLYEGDEIHTGKDSVLWVYLIDGSLLRVSPESSVSFLEINFSETEILTVSRLNYGHIFYSPRETTNLKLDYLPETDSFSLPLKISEANQQYYERKIYESQNDAQRLMETIYLEDRAIEAQVSKLNELKKDNNSLIKVKSKALFISANATLISEKIPFDFLNSLSAESYVKPRNFPEGGSLQIQLRGYAEDHLSNISDNEWFKILSDGKSFEKVENPTGILQVLELLTKRIKTIELGREIWVKNFTIPILNLIHSPQKIAEEFGYSMWGDDYPKRIEYILEYIRRVETTNLTSVQNMNTRLRNKGESLYQPISEDHFRKSINHYLLGLKSRYDNSKMKIREFNDLEFYVWMLKNGKL